MTMSVEAAAGIQRRCLAHCLHWFGQASPGAHVIELPGVTASVVPAVPGRSIANGATFETAADLGAAYDELAAAYERAGIAAWTVWAPNFDAEAEALLIERGHKLDGEPGAMVATLADVELPGSTDAGDLGDLEWDRQISPQELGELNDVAYGHAGGDGMAAAFGPSPPELRFHWYRAVVDGEAACGLVFADAGEDAGVYFVATASGHRGRGLATRLMAIAMSEARDRGQATSSLQATEMGEPVYAALGYRRYFAFRMFERRAPDG